MTQEIHHFRGRSFTPSEIEIIKRIITRCRTFGRTKISKIVCEKLNWYQPNGRLKDTACREALRRMEKKGLIILPSPSACGGRKEIKQLTAREVNFKRPSYIIEENIKTLGKPQFKLLNMQNSERLWRYLMQVYHYLGYKPTVGRYLKYFVCLDEKLVALLGFGDGIYHHNLRDKWIGWSKANQQKNRHLIVNNVRFLILPWVNVKNLASKILSNVAKILPMDWEKKYGYKPLLLETFVDIDRFNGTCYKAANWLSLGLTKGKGRKGLNYFFHGKVREYYVYPLARGALLRLKNEL